MKIIELDIEQIIPYDRNPRVNDHAVEGVKRSIKEFGYIVPIIIDKDNVIIAGHTRIKALKELGVEKVSCIRAEDLTEKQVEAFRIVDNKVHEFSMWDNQKLKEEIDAIIESDLDVEILGFSQFEIDNIGEDFYADRFTIEEFEEFEEFGEWSGLKSTVFSIRMESKEEQEWFKKLIGEEGRLKRSYTYEALVENGDF